MIAILGSGWLPPQLIQLVYIKIIVSKVAAEDGFVEFDVAGVGIKLAEASVPALNNHATFELEGECSVAR